MTKEDLMQLSELMDRKLDQQKQEITELMDRKLDQQKQDITELMDQKLQEQDKRFDQKLQAQEERFEQKLQQQKQEIIQECTANMNVIVESEVTPKFNLLAEEIENIKMTMATKKQIYDLEERMDNRFDILETVVKYHGTEINRLKKAQ